ncbi:hypothetical protein TNCV_4296301 [Trichonephila clavipes]|nr:hypothetical protein TNCV_4296301 [Trichonephila clavipes]
MPAEPLSHRVAEQCDVNIQSINQTTPPRILRRTSVLHKPKRVVSCRAGGPKDLYPSVRDDQSGSHRTWTARGLVHTSIGAYKQPRGAHAEKGLYPDQTGSHCTWTATATLSGHTLTREIAGGSFVTAQCLPYHVAWSDEIVFALSDLTTEEEKKPCTASNVGGDSRYPSLGNLTT